VRRLTREMARANPLWGAPRIHGELLKLGFAVSERTISRLMRRRRSPPSQTWRTFLENHRGSAVAIDFFSVPTLTCRILFVLVVLAHDRRRILHVNVTPHPTSAWTRQQLREAFPHAANARFLLYDRDTTFDEAFGRAVEAFGLTAVRTAPRSPWQNPYVERVIGSIRRECLDHVIVFNERHLRRVLRTCGTITARFRTLYVFVVLDVGTRRIVHWNVTEHPTAEWTVQQFRAILPGDQPQRFLIHDRDSIYAAAVDGAVEAMGLIVLKTPVRCPQANAFCERLIGTIRRECLDWLIVLHERHLRAVLLDWVVHYNQGRPHASLGPGIPEVPVDRLARPNGHQIPDGQRVIAAPILGGLHHEYRLEPLAA
jgi:transposase InsO family protein